MGSADGGREIEGLYGSARNWTLAQDTALFGYLEAFTNRVASRTEGTAANLENASQDCQRSRIRLQTCLNSFNMLSNKQFIESRVRDEESPVKKKEEPPAAEAQVNSGETPESKRVNELREAVSLTKSVLQTYFDVVEISVDDSDDEDTSAAKRTFREPKDPYLRRALPYLIGSDEFNRDRFIGLKLKNDEEEVEPEEDVVLTGNLDDILVPAHVNNNVGQPRPRTETNGSSQSEVQTSGEDLRNAGYSPVIPGFGTAGRKATTVISSSEDEDESDIFTARSAMPPANRPGSQIPAVDSARSTPPPMTRSSSQSSTLSSVPAKPPNQSALFDADDEDDLFSVKAKPKPVKTTDKPTAKPAVAVRAVDSAKSSRTTSIFDDEEEHNDLFSTTKPAAAKPALPNPLLSELSKKIGAPGPLPSIPSVSPVVADSSVPVRVSEDVRVDKPSPVIAPPRKIAPPKKSALFDDDDDDDLFNIPSKPLSAKPPAVRSTTGNDSKPVQPSTSSLPVVPPVAARKPEKSKKVSIFDDDDDDEDQVFSSKPAVKPVPKKQGQPVPAALEPVKIPVVDAPPAVQGPLATDEDELFASETKWKLPGLTAEPATKSTTQEKPPPVVAPASAENASLSTEGPPAVTVKSRKPVSLFDDGSDSEDLFAAATKPVAPAPRKTAPKEQVAEEKKPAEPVKASRVPDVVPQIKENGTPTIEPQQNTPPLEEEDSDLFAVKKPVSQIGKVEKWKLPGLSGLPVRKPKENNEESKAVDDPLGRTDLVGNDDKETEPEMVPEKRSPLPEFSRQLGLRERSDTTESDSTDAADSSKTSEAVSEERESKDLSAPKLPKSLDRGDSADTDFADPDLLPPPKTAPPALFPAMKWKLPGLSKVNEIIDEAGELNDNSNVEAVESRSPVAEKPQTEKPTPVSRAPVPVPRRRAVVKPKLESPASVEKAEEGKQSVELKTEDLIAQQPLPEVPVITAEMMPPRRSPPLEQPADVFGEIKSRPKPGDMIPMIPEMTIDGPLPKPPVAVRRSNTRTSEKDSSEGMLRDVEDSKSETGNPVMPLSVLTPTPPLITEEERPLSVISSLDRTPSPSFDNQPPAEPAVETDASRSAGQDENSSTEPEKLTTFDPLSSMSPVETAPAKPEPEVPVAPVKLKPATPIFEFKMPEPSESLFQAPEPPPLSMSSSLSSSQTSLKKRGGSLFLDEDSDEELFSTSKSKTSSAKVKQPTAVGKKSTTVAPRKSSIFDEDRTDSSLLADPLSGSVAVAPVVVEPRKKEPAKGPSRKEKQNKPALFDSDDDDLFASSQNAAKQVAQTLAKQSTPSPAKTGKPALFEDEDDDLFRS